MKERRQHKRIHSPQPLPVLDRMTGEQLGLLVDLSVGGLLIKTKTVMQVDDIYQLQIMLPQPVGQSKNIEFEAEVVRADSSAQEGIYCAGFLAVNISDYELERIEQLLDLWVLEETCVDA